jgi:hypothetical protein
MQKQVYSHIYSNKILQIRPIGKIKFDPDNLHQSNYKTW